MTSLVGLGLAMRYGHRHPWLFQNRDIEASEGECLAVTGRSGSGKSTLLYCLGALIRPVTGKVMIDGVDVSGMGDHERARLRASRIGFVFQDSLLDPTRSVMAGVVEPHLYGRTPRRVLERRAQGLLDEYGIGDLTHRRPTQLSGGQAQRAGLARALVTQPDVLIADEPTGNLDQESGEIVVNGIRRYVTGHSAVAVIATHDPLVAERCDAVIVLR